MHRISSVSAVVERNLRYDVGDGDGGDGGDGDDGGDGGDGVNARVTFTQCAMVSNTRRPARRSPCTDTDLLGQRPAPAVHSMAAMASGLPIWPALPTGPELELEGGLLPHDHRTSQRFSVSASEGQGRATTCHTISRALKRGIKLGPSQVIAL